MDFRVDFRPAVERSFARVKQAIRHDVLATANELQAEIHRVLIRKFSWDPERTRIEPGGYLIGAVTVQLTHRLNICRVPKDNMFLECAELSGAHVLVSGDDDLLVLGSHKQTRILTPLQYISLPISG